MRLLKLLFLAIVLVASLGSSASAQASSQSVLPDPPSLTLDDPGERGRFRRRVAGGAMLGAALLGAATTIGLFSLDVDLPDAAAATLVIGAPTLMGIVGASLGALLGRTVHPLRFGHALLGATVGVLVGGAITMALFVPAFMGGDGAHIIGFAVGLPLGLAAIAGLTAFVSVRLTRREHARVEVAAGLGTVQLTSRF